MNIIIINLFSFITCFLFSGWTKDINCFSDVGVYFCGIEIILLYSIHRDSGFYIIGYFLQRPFGSGNDGRSPIHHTILVTHVAEIWSGYSYNKAVGRYAFGGCHQYEIRHFVEIFGTVGVDNDILAFYQYLFTDDVLRTSFEDNLFSCMGGFPFCQ